jgi:tetratricopeptide (TPR) repeat protein
VIARAVLVVTMLLAAPATAEDRTAAREAFAEGVAQYDLNHYVEALEAFERAYRHFASPSFLYNIARCHTALGQNDEAVQMYRRYLATGQVEAGERAQIEALVHDLEAQLDQPAAIARRPERKPRRAWIWGVVAGAVVVAAVVLGVGIGVGTQPHPPQPFDGVIRF